MRLSPSRLVKSFALTAGRHGEYTTSGDGVSRIAAHIAARVGGLADAGQFLVSQTVHDLVAGSGISLSFRVYPLAGTRLF